MKPFRFSAPACIVACAVMLMPIAARAQVLDQVPGDALVVIKLNKLKQTSEKMAAFADKLGLAQQMPAAGDPIESLKGKLGIKQGLDDSGDAVIFFPNMEKEGEPAMVILVPVSDYKAFIGNFEGATTEGEVTTATLGEEEKESFIIERGKYAAISNEKAALDQKPDGIKAEGLSAKELDGKDVVAYVNMKSARAKILPEITKNRQKIIDEVEKNMKQGAAGPRRGPQEDEDSDPAAPAPANAQQEKMIPLVRAFVNRGLDVVEQLVRDADAATYGLSFGDAGVNSTTMVQFAKESPSAKRVAELKNTDQSLLAGLPQGKYMFFGGSSDEASAGAKIIADFVAPLEKEFAALGDAEGKALQGYLDGIKQYAAAVKMSAFGMATPSGMLGQDAIVQAIGVSVGDAKAVMEAQKKMFDAQQGLMSLMSVGGVKTEVQSSYKENAKTVDGVTLNQMTTNFAPPAGQQATPQQMQMQQMMTFMYGPGGVTAWLGAVGNDKVISAAGANDELLGKLIASAKTGEDVLSKSAGLSATVKELPKERMVAAYVSLDQIAKTLANYARALMGMQLNLQLPDDLPPLGITMGTDGDGTALRADGHMPAQTLQSIIAAVMQVQMQMQGGQQPGGPGGL